MALRVLVVEDEPEMAALLARGLRGEGYEVDTAERRNRRHDPRLEASRTTSPCST